MIIGYVFMLIGFIAINIPPCFGIQVGLVMNLTDQSKLLLLQTYNFYKDKSPQFELTSFIQVVTSLLALAVFMLVDTFLLLIILHICGQLEIFRHRLVNLISRKSFDRALNNIIVTHSRLIRFADSIENMYSLLMLISILYFSIVFCLSGFLFAIVLTDTKMDKADVAQVFYTAIMLIVLLINTFIYSGAGEFLMEHILKTSCGYISILLAKHG